MKQVTLVLVLILGVVFGTAANKPGKEKEVKIKTSAQCDMCKERIEKNLTLSKGVTEAILNLDDKVVTVKYNPKRTDEDKLRKIITETGYDADNLMCVQSAHDKLPSCCQKDAEPHGHKN
ncbi:MAG: heavy-metal-associated domain-containing protein [Spirosomaceae bacterium]|jgi:periplasmic mercuric ion binding protein|nr:heavy-metal-associated domain-containing protein [Spirosomataceae bacterium]